MTESSWVKLKDYASQLDAELDLGVLEEAGIPTLKQGPEVGIFGPGFAGATPRGVTLLVPRDQLVAARELIGDAPERP